MIDAKSLGIGSVRTIEQFKQWTRDELRPILPHETLACGFGHIHAGGVALDGIVAVNYPAAHLDGIRNRAGGIDTPILRRWLATREPQLFDPDRPWPDVPDAWLSSFRRFGLGRTAAHAVYDTERCIGTYHSFHRVAEDLSDRHIALLKEIVPIMHEALCPLIERLNAENEFATYVAALTECEHEVVCWVGLGKTNGEIASLIGSTECAVKHRLMAIFDKLRVGSRAQLVRRMAEHASHKALGYGTKLLYEGNRMSRLTQLSSATDDSSLTPCRTGIDFP